MLNITHDSLHMDYVWQYARTQIITGDTQKRIMHKHADKLMP